MRNIARQFDSRFLIINAVLQLFSCIIVDAYTTHILFEVIRHVTKIRRARRRELAMVLSLNHKELAFCFKLSELNEFRTRKIRDVQIFLALSPLPGPFCHKELG